MIINIHFHGAIDRRGHQQDHIETCPDGTTVEQLLLRLGYPPIQLRSIVPLLNGTRIPMDRVLLDNTSLDILAPAGGG